MQSQNRVENRSEIVFFYDAERSNPNGNPMSSDNSPRVDKRTGHAIVTDVRLKRYLRDQLSEDGASIYIKNTGNNDTRGELLSDLFNEDEVEDLLRDDDREPDEVAERIHEILTENAIDIRLFGATLSVDGDDSELFDVLSNEISHLTGPVQFSPPLSLNTPVQFNEEYDSLTSVVSNNEEAQGGGFGLDDKRIKYAVFPFHGIVNENAAEDTNLTQEDVERLDTLCWRSIKNQTLTRSKVGQEPRLYVRVEYGTDNYHIGDLHHTFELAEETPEPDALRKGRDVCLDVTDFVATVSQHSEHIKTVHINGSDVFNYKVDGEVGDFSTVYSAVSDVIGSDSVNKIEVYE